MWPTPTPIPIPEATPPFQLPTGTETELAEWIVQGWQQANQHGLLDVLFLAGLVFLVVAGVYLITQRVREL